MVKAMELLKSALAERQAKARKVIEETGTTWVRRSELEKRRKEEYLENLRLEEEKQKAEEDARFERLREHLTSKEGKEPAPAKEIPAHLLNEALLDDDAEPPVGIGEVIDRLREMAQPITLFGETDMQRYKRLRSLEKEAHEGKKNPDLVMLENVHFAQQQQMGENDMADEAGDAEEDGEGQAGGAAASDKSDSDHEEDPEEREARAAARQASTQAKAREPVPEDKSDSDAEDVAAPDQDKSDSDAEDVGQAKLEAGDTAVADNGATLGKPLGEQYDGPPVEVDLKLMDKCDSIRAWARKALKAWEKELADLPEEEKKKAITKTEIAAHRQVRRDVRPLQKRLRLYIMEERLLDKIYSIVSKAAEREYRDASEAYLDLTIGRAAWPVGIGCGGSMLMEDAIGLHDRFNRMENVRDNSVTLNDDVTRKYVQALKRLMNKAQRYWPPDDPSKA